MCVLVDQIRIPSKKILHPLLFPFFHTLDIRLLSYLAVSLRCPKGKELHRTWRPFTSRKVKKQNNDKKPLFPVWMFVNK